jgi:hypothetical protein
MAFWLFLAISVGVVHCVNVGPNRGLFDRLLAFLGGRSSARGDLLAYRFSGLSFFWLNVLLAYRGDLFHGRGTLAAHQPRQNPSPKRLKKLFSGEQRADVLKIPIEPQQMDPPVLLPERTQSSPPI